MTAGPAGRVGALLELYRPVADELFVAVDDRAGNDVVTAVADAGARVVRYPYAEPVDRPLAWLHAQCRGAWVLTIDDDEVPSAALLAQLPALLAARDVTHYWVPRRWLYPDEGCYLDEAPWRPDYQLRLVENDPRLLRFFEETHRPMDVVGPGRYLDAPVYHADCVVNPLERRLEKARKYERLRPGKRVAGGAMSHVFYLPERRPDAATAPLPEDDAELVRVVLAAPGPPASAAARVVPFATREEIDRAWVGRELGEEAYRARIELRGPPAELLAGEKRALEAVVANEGDVEWPWGEDGRPELRVSYRWLRLDGSAAVADGLRTPFPAPVAPGQTAVVQVHVAAPAAPGPYVLEVDLVHEHVRWFGCATRHDVDVRAARSVALAGAPERVGAVVRRLVDEVPEVEPVVLAGDDGHGPSGYRSAPAVEPFLLGASRRGRAGLAVLALRTLALTAAARRVRAGGAPGPLPRGGDGFLAELAASQALVLVPAEPGMRRLWAAAATASAAGALGVPVVAVPPPEAAYGGPLARLLARPLVRMLARRVTFVSLEAAAGEAARRSG